MEHNDRYLDFLSSSMIQYLNEVLIKKNCVLPTLRKHSIKNEEDVEFSFLLKPVANSSSDDILPFSQIGFNCLSEEELRRIVVVSESWCLHLASALVREGRLCLKLNRPKTFSTIIRVILKQKSNYGKRSVGKQIVRITSDETNISDLTEYRCSLLKAAVENILKASGYVVSSTEGQRWLHFTTDCRKQPDVAVLCGPVLNSATKQKETLIGAAEYRRLCRLDLEKISLNKNSESPDEELDTLSDASVKISLLQVKSSQALNLNLQQVGPGEKPSKGGVFLQYNASRLAAVRKKFEESVRDGIYPPLPDLKHVDFDSLRESEEWALLFNFLLEFPSLIDDISENVLSGKAHLHRLCNFLLQLCSLFSIYYRRVRILLPARTHLFPVIHARVVLVTAIEQVLENGFAILNISKIEHM